MSAEKFIILVFKFMQQTHGRENFFVIIQHSVAQAFVHSWVVPTWGYELYIGNTRTHWIGCRSFKWNECRFYTSALERDKGRAERKRKRWNKLLSKKIKCSKFASFGNVCFIRPFFLFFVIFVSRTQVSNFSVIINKKNNSLFHSFILCCSHIPMTHVINSCASSCASASVSIYRRETKKICENAYWNW